MSLKQNKYKFTTPNITIRRATFKLIFPKKVHKYIDFYELYNKRGICNQKSVRNFYERLECTNYYVELC